MCPLWPMDEGEGSAPCLSPAITRRGLQRGCVSLLGQVPSVCTVLGEEPRCWESCLCHGSTREKTAKQAAPGVFCWGPQAPRGPLLSLTAAPAAEQARAKRRPTEGRAELPQKRQGPISPGEGVPGIVHDTVKIIGLPQGLHLLELHLQEVILLPCEDQEKEVGGGEGQVCAGGSVTFSW